MARILRSEEPQDLIEEVVVRDLVLVINSNQNDVRLLVTQEFFFVSGLSMKNAFFPRLRFMTKVPRP